MFSSWIIVASVTSVTAVLLWTQLQRRRGTASPPTWQSHVLPHSPLTAVDEGASPRLWQVTGSVARLALPRRMVVYRRDDGSLLIHSAVAVDEATLSALLSLGPPAALVVPNSFHRLDCGVYMRRMPQLAVFCPPVSNAAVASALPGIVLHDSRELEAAGSVKVYPIPGWNKAQPFEHAFELRVSDGTWAFVVTDSVFNVPPLAGGIGRFIQKLLANASDDGLPVLSRIARFMINDRKAVAAFFASMAEREDVSIIAMGHGDIVRGVDNCRRAFRQLSQSPMLH